MTTTFRVACLQTQSGNDLAANLETLRTMTRIWRGDLPWPAALRSGELVLRGEPQACRALPRWLKLSSLAPTPRPERVLAAG